MGRRRRQSPLARQEDTRSIDGRPSPDRQDLEFLLLRAEQALRTRNLTTAAELALVGIRNATGLRRAIFQRLRGRALIETSRTVEAVELLRESLAGFVSLRAKAYAARTTFDLARAHARLHEHEQALRHGLAASEAIDRRALVDRTLELDIQRFLAGVYIGLGQPDAAALRAERALAIAEDIADPGVTAKLYETLSLTRYGQGDDEAALAYLLKSIDLYRSLGSEEKLAETNITLGWLFIQRQQYTKAGAALDQAEAIASRAGIARLKAWIALNRGALALARGDHRSAQRLANTAGEGAVGRLRARALLLRAKATAAAGTDLSEVRGAFEAAIQAHGTEPPGERARAHRAYADALAARNQHQEALAQARAALSLVAPGT